MLAYRIAVDGFHLHHVISMPCIIIRSIQDCIFNLLFFLLNPNNLFYLHRGESFYTVRRRSKPQVSLYHAIACVFLIHHSIIFILIYWNLRVSVILYPCPKRNLIWVPRCPNALGYCCYSHANVNVSTTTRLLFV